MTVFEDVEDACPKAGYSNSIFLQSLSTPPICIILAINTSKRFIMM